MNSNTFKGYTLKKLSTSYFSQMEYEWQECLECTEANKLFSSWIWNHTWWKVWQPRLGLELLLIGVYHEGKLVAIAPCYTYIRKKWGIQFKYCEFIGNYSVNDDSIRSEYLDFIIPQKAHHIISPLILDFIKNSGIDQCIFRDLSASSLTAQSLVTRPNTYHYHEEYGIKVNCQGTFENYVGGLSKNNRLKMYNRRRLLVAPCIHVVNSLSDLDTFFTQLNGMHQNRWGKHCFSSHSLNFHMAVSHYFLQKGSLKSIVLMSQDSPLAVCYDILVAGVRYNIQSGFYAPERKNLSLGTLSFGYALEDSFKDQTTLAYDFLAGNGMNSFYKEKFKGESVRFISTRLTFNKILILWHYSVENIKRVMLKLKLSKS